MTHPYLDSVVFCCISTRRRSLLLLLLACLVGLPCIAQQPLETLLVGVDRRSTTSLDGNWHYLVDQVPARGLYNSNGTVRDNGYGLNTHPNISTSLPHNDEYDFATAPTLKVPGDWNTQDPTLFRYEGVVWYQRDFSFQPRPHTRTFLHIGAANYKSFAWVNGKRICDHEGGFTPFDCEVTAAVKAGSNFVVIAVDSTREVDGIPSVAIDWFNYGGLTRDVSLVTLPESFIDDYDVHLRKDATFSPSNHTLVGYIHVVGASAGTPVTLRIPEAGVSTTIQTDASGTAPFEVNASSLSLWSPSNPKLYRVELASGQDALTDAIGFRDIRVEGTRILLNGTAIFLDGVNMHAEAPYRTGRVDSDEDVKNLFGFLKDLNANFVRLCHYPQDQRMERYADAHGVMIWSEIPIWQHISFEKPAVYVKALTMLKEMIRRDRNKASVIMWSVSNETPNIPARTHFLTDLANEARHLDPTRPITSALLGPRPIGNQMIEDDPLAAALDIIGQNEYIGWYVGKAEDADTMHWTFTEQKPVIMSEFGAEARQGNHGSIHDRWTEEQQVDVLKHQLVMIGKIPQVRGLCPWVLMDFRSPTRNIPGLQDGFNRKGLLSEDGKKKLAFDLFQQVYKDHSVGKAE
jgi:beta-glucuronidase